MDGTTVVLAAALGQTLLFIFHASRPWWRDWPGRALFFHTFIWTAVIDMVAFSRLHPWPGEAETFTRLYAVAAVGIWALFFTLVGRWLHNRGD